MQNPTLGIVFEGSDAECTLDTFFDDDNETWSYIRRDVAERLGPLSRIRSPWDLGARGRVTHSIPLTFIVDGVELRDDFLVVDALRPDVLVGSGTCAKCGLHITEDGALRFR